MEEVFFGGARCIFLIIRVLGDKVDFEGGKGRVFFRDEFLE